MALGALKAGPFEGERPGIRSLQTPDRSVRRGAGKPSRIEAEGEVAEDRRRRLDRDQDPARRQRFAQPRQLPPFRQAVQALGSEHEIVARSLEPGVRLQQAEAVVPMGGALGGLEAAAVRLGHRQLDIVAALDLDERRRQRTETDLQDAQRTGLGPQPFALKQTREERARLFERNARGVVEVENRRRHGRLCGEANGAIRPRLLDDPGDRAGHQELGGAARVLAAKSFEHRRGIRKQRIPHHDPALAARQ